MACSRPAWCGDAERLGERQQAAVLLYTSKSDASGVGSAVQLLFVRREAPGGGGREDPVWESETHLALERCSDRGLIGAASVRDRLFDNIVGTTVATTPLGRVGGKARWGGVIAFLQWSVFT